ncbi:MAG: Gfo/Idh/MocA family oxidoreductase [Planctomycetes bacterium]|nr:Gfo/Idh/MocA family oxidoreductase [Planctomycetota bacterium]
MAVRVGFIGTGGISRMHRRNLTQLPDVEIVAMCDVVEEKVQEAAAEHSARAYTDYRKMLRKGGLDVVYVCLPPFAHGKVENAVIKKGLHMFVEKPVHVDARKAAAIARKIQDAGLITATGYQDRYLDIIDTLQGLLRDHKPGMVMGYWMGGMPGVAWWRVKALSGGQAVEQTTHIFDMCRYLFGEVTEVYAGGTKGLMADVEDYDIEDASAVTLRFANGLVAVVFSACFLSVGNRGGLDIFCKDCFIEYKERKSITVHRKGVEPEQSMVENNYQLATDTAFINAIKTGDPSQIKSPYADAVRSLELSTAANKSMETGKPVRLKPIV